MRLGELLPAPKLGSVGLVLLAGIGLQVCGSQAVLAEPMAKEALAPELVQALEERDRKIAERDTIIANLLQRVQQLEHRLDASGIPGPAGQPPSSQGPATSVAAADSPGQEDQAKTESAQGGGGRPAPGTVEVDELAAERALERTLTETGALLLPRGVVEVDPSITYGRIEEDYTLWTGRTVGTNEVRAAVDLRVGLPWDSQFELGLPSYGTVHQDTRTVTGIEPAEGAGFGDLSLGFAKTLLRERGWRPDLIARLTYNSGSGDRYDDSVYLGGGSRSIEGQLVALKRQDPLAFVGSVSYQKTFEKDNIEFGNAVSFSLGAYLAASPETSLRFTFLQTFRDERKENGQVLPGTGATPGTLAIGASSILGRGVLLNTVFGVGLGRDATDYFFQVSLPIRFDKWQW